MRRTFALACAVWAVSLPAKSAPVGQLAFLQDRLAAQRLVTEMHAPSVIRSELAEGHLQSASIHSDQDTFAQVFTPPAAPAAEPAGAGERAAREPLTNNDIIQLVQAKQFDSLIINYIRTSPCAFDTSVEGLRKLEQAGVSASVRQAMIDVGKSPVRVPRSALDPAREALQAGDFRRAVSQYTDLLQQYPDSAQLYDMRAQAYLLERQPDMALADYAHAIQLDPKSPIPYLNRSRIYQGRGEYERALQDLDCAVELSPNSPGTHMARASVRDRLYDFQGELEDLDAVLRLQPGMPIAQRLRDRVLRRLGSGGATHVWDSAPGALRPAGGSNKTAPKPPTKPDTPDVSGIRVIDDDVTPPVGIHTPDAPYTSQARVAGRTGSVKLEITVDTQGNVTNATEVSPKLGLGLDESAVQTVRTWKFKPATVNGAPTSVRVVVEFHFAPS